MNDVNVCAACGASTHTRYNGICGLCRRRDDVCGLCARCTACVSIVTAARRAAQRDVDAMANERRVYDADDVVDMMDAMNTCDVDAAVHAVIGNDDDVCNDASCAVWHTCAVYRALRALPVAYIYDADVRGICAVNDADNDDASLRAWAHAQHVTPYAVRCDVCDADADVCAVCHVCRTCTAHDATCADAVPCATCNGDVLKRWRDDAPHATLYADVAHYVTAARIGAAS